MSECGDTVRAQRRSDLSWSQKRFKEEARAGADGRMDGPYRWSLVGPWAALLDGAALCHMKARGKVGWKGGIWRLGG